MSDRGEICIAKLLRGQKEVIFFKNIYTIIVAGTRKYMLITV